jgi:hypothetical protein
MGTEVLGLGIGELHETLQSELAIVAAAKLGGFDGLSLLEQKVSLLDMDMTSK